MYTGYSDGEKLTGEQSIGTIVSIFWNTVLFPPNITWGVMIVGIVSLTFIIIFIYLASLYGYFWTPKKTKTKRRK